MAKKESSATQLLKHVSSLLAQASRHRENNAFDQANICYNMAEREFAAFGGCPDEAREDCEELRQTVAAELLLVEAILHAHQRSPDENATHFAAARAAATALGDAEMQGRVECCWGATLLFERNPETALIHLEAACEWFKYEDHHYHDERVQATYHYARALVALQRQGEAIQTLKEAIPANPYVMAASKHDLAAMTLLATLIWRSLRSHDRREANRLLRDAINRGRINNLHHTPQFTNLCIIKRFGFFGYIIFPPKARWPEL